MTSIWTVRRSPTDAKLTGLCGGVAQHWGIDPVLVRLGFVLLALSGGVGLVLYAAGWLLIPVAGKDSAPVDDFFGGNRRRWPKEWWIALVVVASILIFTAFGSLSPFGMTPAIVIAVVWYFGFYKKSCRNHRSDAPPAAYTAIQPAPTQFRYPGPETPFTVAATSWQRRMEEVATQGQPVAQPPAPTQLQPQWPTRPYPQTSQTQTPQTQTSQTQTSRTQTQVQDPAREDHVRDAYFAIPDPVGLYVEPEPVAHAVIVRRGDSPAARRLRLIALVVVGLTLAGLGIADNLGAAVPFAAYLGAPLLVLALTLVAAAWLGRARGILPVAILLAAAMLASSAPSPVGDPSQWTSSSLRFERVADLPPAGTSLAGGELRVDLSSLDVTTDTAYRAHVGTGELVVIAPPGANVLVKYNAGMGFVEAFDTEIASTSHRSGEVWAPGRADPAEPTLTLDLSVGKGHLEVRQ